MGRLLPHISPAWGDKPEGLLSRAMVAFVRATHRVFFGRDAWKDTYPLILKELGR